MVDLLNTNKKSNTLSEIKSKPVTKNRVDISRYHDPEGLSISKLETGLWFLKHRIFFLYLFYGLLILISLVTWPWFVWTYGHYVFVGMKADKLMLDEFANNDTAQILTAMQAQRPKDLQWQSPEVVKNEKNERSFVVKVYNPNPDYMVNFSYSFSSGEAETDTWKNFLYPGESKYVVVLGSKLAQNSRLPVFNIKEANWDRISRHDYPDWQEFLSTHFDVLISNEEFVASNRSLISNKEKFSQISFSAKNKTAYSYKDVAFTILLKQGQSIVGAERWTAEKFISGQTYDYNLSILGSYNNVSSLEIYPEINVTDMKNYLYISSGPAESK